jgi:hypothetical protein
MKHMNRRMVVVLIILVVLLLFYKRTQTSDTPVKIEPAMVESIPGTDFKRVTLTTKAFERLAIETVPIREERAARSGKVQKIVPYASVLYGLHGETWLYINPEPLIFVRYLITIDYIDGDLVYLTEGPPAGTSVVTVGVAELYGADTGVGK